MSVEVNLLYLYSGPDDSPVGFNVFAGEFRARVDMIDTLNDKIKHDVLDDLVWSKLEERLDNDEFDGGLIASPCSSFTPCRRQQDGEPDGPGMLRGPEAPESYGLKDLHDEDKQFVREGTAMAIRGATTAGKLYDHDRPWISETPKRKPDSPCVHKLPEWKEVHNRIGVNLDDSAQCMHGARTTKPTEWMWYIADCSDMPKKCLHQRQRWKIPWNGKLFVQPHPPLRGRQWAVLEKDWNPDMLRRYEPSGPYITKSAAVYPGRLNLTLAFKLVRAVKLQRVRRLQTDSMVTTGRFSNTMLNKKLFDSSRLGDLESKVTFAMPLRGERLTIQERRRQEAEAKALGGMRRPRDSIAKCPGHLSVGNEMFKLFNQALDDHPDLEKDILSAINQGSDEHQVPGDDALKRIRSEMATLVNASSIEAASNQTCNTDVRADLLYAWANKAGDKGKHVALWCHQGAPAGILKEFDLEDVFPPSFDNEELDDHDTLETNF